MERVLLPPPRQNLWLDRVTFQPVPDVDLDR